FLFAITCSVLAISACLKASLSPPTASFNCLAYASDSAVGVVPKPVEGGCTVTFVFGFCTVLLLFGFCPLTPATDAPSNLAYSLSAILTFSFNTLIISSHLLLYVFFRLSSI